LIYSQYRLFQFPRQLVYFKLISFYSMLIVYNLHVPMDTVFKWSECTDISVKRVWKEITLSTDNIYQ